VPSALPSGCAVTDAGIPDEVRQLLARHVHTMEQVEVLLLLARSADRTLGVDEIRAELRLPATALAPRTFAGLEDGRLIVAESGVPLRYRYAPASAELRRAVELLADAYNTRPVTLVRMIYDRPSPAQVFADAFRLRTEGDS
jgi:hypothetical protein